MILNQHEPGFVYFTKSVRIPIDKIIGVRHTPNGDGCVIETDRGMTTVLDDYEAVVAYLYGKTDGGEDDND